MPTASPIMKIMLTTKKERSMTRPTRAARPMAMKIEMKPTHDRQSGGNQRAQQHDQNEHGDRDTDLLALGQILLGDRAELVAQGRVAHCQDLVIVFLGTGEGGLVVGHALDGFVEGAVHDYRDDGRMAVGRNQRGIAGRVERVDRAGQLGSGLQLGDQAVDLCLEGRIVDRRAF